MTKTLPTPGALTASGASYDGVTHAGLAIVAADTGHVLLAQRAMDETDAPEVQETYEFPGGGLDVPEEPLEGAMREYSEEVCLPLPEGEVVNGWRSSDGVYQGFVYLIETEFSLAEFTPNEEVQAVDWFSREMIDAADNLRPEVRNDTDWDMIFGSVSGNRDFSEVTRLMTQGLPEATEPDLTASSLPTGPVPIHGVLAPENLPSGDMRGINEGGITRRGALRLPFRHQKSDMPGHQGAITVGSIDRMMRRGGLIHWEGTLLDNDEAEEFIGLLVHFGRYGVSIDGDKAVLDADRSKAEGMMWLDATRIAGATACAIPAFAEAWVALGHHPEMPAEDTEEALVASGLSADDIIGKRVTFDRGAGWVTNPKETKRLHDYWTKPGEEGYAKIGWGKSGDYRRCLTLVGEKIAKNSPEDMRYMKRICAQWHHDALGYWPGDLGKPGNAPDTPENRKRAAIHAASDAPDYELIKRSDAIEAERDAVVEATEGLAVVEGDDAEWEAVLVSSASAGARPPLSYFHRHESTEALVVEEPDANGFRRTYGYVAEWGVCHVGMEGRCVEPPMTGSDDYPEFHLGRTKTSEGFVYTGLLTYGVGHRDAQTILSESPTQQHFDNIKNAWAAVRIGEDERGIWFSGVVLPKVDPEDLTLIQASGQVSGEWKHGALRAALTVNVPGFPVERPSAEYDAEGNVVALAASAFGGVSDAPCNEVSGNADDPVGDVALAVMERIEARQKMQVIREAEAKRRFAALKQEWEA